MTDEHAIVSKTIQGWRFDAIERNVVLISRPHGAVLRLEFSDHEDEIYDRPIGWFWAALNDAEEFMNEPPKETKHDHRN